MMLFDKKSAISMPRKGLISAMGLGLISAFSVRGGRGDARGIKPKFGINTHEKILDIRLNTNGLKYVQMWVFFWQNCRIDRHQKIHIWSTQEPIFCGRVFNIKVPIIVKRGHEKP